jgi:hypothetical protein
VGMGSLFPEVFTEILKPVNLLVTGHEYIPMMSKEVDVE